MRSLSPDVQIDDDGRILLPQDHAACLTTTFLYQEDHSMGKITNYFTANGFGRVLVIRGRRGEKVHELIEKTMTEAGILNGEAHLHVAAQDHCTAIIAHLERDTEILYVAEIVVAELLLDKKVERIKIAEGNNQFEIED